MSESVADFPYSAEYQQVCPLPMAREGFAHYSRSTKKPPLTTKKVHMRRKARGTRTKPKGTRKSILLNMLRKSNNER